MYVWSDYVRWNQQVETRAVLAAGEACRALVTRQQSTGGARPRGLQDAGGRVGFLIRDRDAKCRQAFDAVFADAGLEVVTSGIRMPRMNSPMERWIQTCRRELLDRTLIWNQSHLLHALRKFASFCNGHRPHRALGQAAPLRPLPEPLTAPGQIAHLKIHRRDRLGGTLHECHACRLNRPDD